MYFSHSLIFSLLTTALAAPTAIEQEAKKGSFKLEAVRRTSPSLAWRKRAFGIGSATPQQQPVHFWTTHVAVGTPFQLLNVTIDTGSGDFWLRAGHDVAPADVNPNHAIFDPTASSTWVNDTSYSFTISFASGSIEGYVGKDTIGYGDVIMPNSRIELAPAVNDVSDTDGIIGMALPIPGQNLPPNVNGPPPPFISELGNSLDSPVLSCDLRSKDVGTFEFGKIDDAKFHGDLTYVNIDPSSGAWKIDQMFFTIGGVPTSASAGTSMILDTDGNTMALDTAVVKSYYAAIPGAKDVSTAHDASAWTVPCAAAMPDLGFNFGSVSSQTNNTATVPGSIIKGGPVDFAGNCGTNLIGGGGNCGHPFFEANFVVFNWAGPFVGIAPHA